MYKNIYAITRGLTSFRFIDASRFREDSLWKPLTKKWLMRINFTCLMLLIGFLQISFAASGQKISLSRKDAPITEIFKELHRQSDYGFLINKEQATMAKPVTISVTDEELVNVLNVLFADQPFSYSIENKMIIVVTKKVNKSSNDTGVTDNINVRGRVLDEKGQPLAKATIKIKGQETTVQSTENGQFFLLGIDDKSIIQISYMGYKSIELAAKDNLGDIRLEIVSSDLSEVTIATGYQRISKEKFVGSYSQLDSAAYARRTGIGILDRLDGTVAGVVFDRKPGQFPIKVRGISTLGTKNTSKNPLIVVDKFAMPENFDLNTINQNDVESITVLKDAAAASIWGTRAGNGVIVITTKKGKFGQPLNVSLLSNVSVDDKPDVFHVPLISPSAFIDVEKFLFNNGYYNTDISNTFSWPALSPAVEILAKTKAGLSMADADKQLDALRGYDVRNDLNNLVYRNASRQQHYLSLTAGTDKLSFQFSGGFNRTLNNTQGSKPDNQVTLTANTVYKVNSKLQFETGINLTNGVVRSNAFPVGLADLFPYGRLADDNGNSLAIARDKRTAYIDTAGRGRYLDGYYRPLDEVLLYNNVITARMVRINTALRYQATDWASANVSYQYSSGFTSGRNFQSLETYATRSLINEFTNLNRTDALRYPVPMGGLMNLSNTILKNYNLRGTLDFNKNWNNKHAITGLFGAEISEASGYGNNQQLYGYNDLTGSSNSSMDFVNFFPKYYATQNGSGKIQNLSNYTDLPTNRFISTLANFSYAYDNRYTLYASARRDGANIFGVNANNRWKPLWSVGASWNISNESFFKSDWLNSLRLRSSYGYTGNVNNTLSGKPTIRYRPTPDTQSGLTAADVGLAPNPDLRWEQVIIKNVGLDFTAFKKLSGSIEIFRKDSKDVISEFPYPISSGVDVFTVNAASLKTKGMDLTMNYKQKIGPVQWNSSLGFSASKTVITELFLPDKFRANEYVGYGLNASKGEIAYGLSSYRWAGLDPQTGDPRGYLKGQVSTDYEAIANDSIQNQIFHGSGIPLQTGFLTNTFKFKGLTLSFNITGKFNYYFREPKMSLLYSRRNTYTIDYLNRWQKPGDEAFTEIPSMVYPLPANASQRDLFYQYSENSVKRGDNIRIQDLRLSYSLSKLQFKSLPFDNVELFGYLNNLNWFLWRKEPSHFDPDSPAGLYDTQAIKIWSFGAKINF